MKYLLLILFFTTTCTIRSNVNNSIANKYSIKCNDSTGNVVITDNKNNHQINWGKIPNCNCSSYHFAEYHNPNLYVTRRFDAKKTDWKDELWVYSSISDSGKQLLNGRGINFIVNNQQTLLSSCNIDTLIIINLTNNKIRKIQISNDTINNKEDYAIESMCWSIEGNTLWATLCWIEGYKYNFFS